MVQVKTVSSTAAQARLRSTQWRGAVEHLSQTLAPTRWRSLRLAMLAAYFDAAGKEHDQTYIVVAGFVSSGRDWATFEKEWQQRLEEDELRYFHANEFAHSIKEFDGWRGDETRRRMLAGDLMAIIQRHVYRKFGTVVKNVHVEQHLSEDVRRQILVNGYVVAGRTTIADVTRWREREGWETAVSYVFEDGDEGKGALSDLLDQHGYPRPSFGPKRDTLTKAGVMRAVVPLQAADWLAYETFQNLKQVDRGAGPEALRWPAREFDSVPGVLGVMEPEHLRTANAGIREFHELRL